MIRRPRLRAVIVALGTARLATTATAHGVTGVAAGLAFPAVVGASAGASLLGGGLVLAVAGSADRSARLRSAVPILFLALGALSVAVAVDGTAVGATLGVVAGVGVVALASGHGLADCADAALGAVTLHRGIEGVVLATVYAADAALGLVGAGVLAVHAAAETAAVGSLYAAVPRRALGAVCVVQVGFVAGVVAGWSVVDAVPALVEAGLLALVGGALLAVGVREGYHRYARRRPVAAA